MSKQNKKPMPKEKKDFVASIIWMVAGALFIAMGGIMASRKEVAIWASGIVVICCGCAMITICIISLIKNHKKWMKEKAR